MIKNTVVASRTLKSNLTNKLLDMMTSDWFLKVRESNKSNIDEGRDHERAISFFFEDIDIAEQKSPRAIDTKPRLFEESGLRNDKPTLLFS